MTQKTVRRDYKMTQKKKIIGLVFKQGDNLKNCKETEDFFETLGLSKSTIYFNINFFKFVNKYPRLKIMPLFA